MEIVNKLVNELIPYARNSRTHSDEQVGQIMASIKEFGWTNPVLIDEDGGIIAGHGRVMAAQRMGVGEVPCITLAGLTEAQKKAYIIADNKLALNAGWDDELLKIELAELDELAFDYSGLGFDFDFDIDIEKIGREKYSDFESGSMEVKYIQPPFSILDTRKTSWVERKKLWRGRIKDFGESREKTLATSELMSDTNNGVSLLDPVMAEIITTWYGMAYGVAFDPFAGDSVFGYVSASLGMGFKGIELRKAQAELNQHRVDEAGLPARYYNDSSENMDTYIDDDSVDLVFSCPPYADLEVYSDDPRDLSNMPHDDFFAIYKKILQNTYAKLKQNRFAVIVMGEVRGKSGAYIGTIPKTIEIMEGAGYKYYNEMILINQEGSLPLRAGKIMQASRKIGKMHQNILVFLKGDAKQAALELGKIDVNFKYEEEDACDDV
jgi:hypothetical protein